MVIWILLIIDNPYPILVYENKIKELEISHHRELKVVVMCITIVVVTTLLVCFG